MKVALGEVPLDPYGFTADRVLLFEMRNCWRGSLFKEVLGSVCQLTFSLTLLRFGKLEKYNLKYFNLNFFNAFNLNEYSGAGKSEKSS